MWFSEPLPFPERGSPIILSTSGQQRYEGWSCIILILHDGFWHSLLMFLISFNNLKDIINVKYAILFSFQYMSLCTLILHGQPAGAQMPNAFLPHGSWISQHIHHSHIYMCMYMCVCVCVCRYIYRVFHDFRT